MAESVLMGKGNKIVKIPQEEWEQQLSLVPQHIKERLNFMTDAHHHVRYFVVKELPRIEKPIQPELIARELSMSLSQVSAILEDLEKNLFFLVRNAEGAVSWAFPVTVDRTPHRLAFSTGERLNAA